jgi:predicted SprT family Zn-dependent metalloprotease
MLETLTLMLRLEHRLEELMGLAFKVYGVEIKKPKVDFELTGFAAAMVKCYTNQLSINPILMVENPEGFLEKTIGHEFCHLGVRRLHPKAQWTHGKQWQGMMRDLNIPIEIDHRYDVSSIVGKTPHTLDYALGAKPDRLELEKELAIYQHYQTRIILG